MRPAIWLAPRSPSIGLYGWRTKILSSLAGLLQVGPGRASRHSSSGTSAACVTTE